MFGCIVCFCLLFWCVSCVGFIIIGYLGMWKCVGFYGRGELLGCDFVWLNWDWVE